MRHWPAPMPTVAGTLERRILLSRLGNNSSPTEYEFEIVCEPGKKNAYLTIPVAPGPVAEARYPLQDRWLTQLFDMEPRIERTWGATWTLHGDTALKKAATMILRTGRIARRDIEARAPAHPAKILAVHPKETRLETLSWVFKAPAGEAAGAKFCKLDASMQYPGGAGCAVCACRSGDAEGGPSAWFREAVGAAAGPTEEVRLDPARYEKLILAALALPAALFESFTAHWEF